MTKMKSKFTSLVILSALVFSFNAKATVFTDRITGGGTANMGADITINPVPINNVPQMGYVSIGFNYNTVLTTTTKVGNRIITNTTPLTFINRQNSVGTGNAGIDAYYVNFGDEFTLNSIQSGSTIPIMSSGAMPTYPDIQYDTKFYLPDFSTEFTGINSESGTFYLGINSGISSLINPINGKADRSIFGWAKFAYNPTSLTMLESAITYDQRGIFIGTLNTVSSVPEPTSTAMFAIGLMGLIGFRRYRFNFQ